MDAISEADIRSAELLYAGPGPALKPSARVCALIPHFDSLKYLKDAVASLLAQTRPLDGIIVIDDDSPVSPVEMLAEFPTVTVLQSAERSGPYALIQRAIELTNFDAYLFQDADDWSAPERLELLLSEAVRSGAEMVGSQGMRIIVDEGEIVTYLHSARPNQQLKENPAANPVHHPTSLVSRDLIMRLGGFPTGLRFSGDTEFQRRAGYVAKLANIPAFVYYYRTHSESLTGSEETGHHTEARRMVINELHQRAYENHNRYLAGFPPRLEPIAVADPVALQHLSGPPLDSLQQPKFSKLDQSRKSRSRPARTNSSQRDGCGNTDPVVIIGAPRSGISLLAGCLAQHSAFHLLQNPEWLPEIAARLQMMFDQDHQNPARSDLAIRGIDVEIFSVHLGSSLSELLLCGAPKQDAWISSRDSSVSEYMSGEIGESVPDRRRLIAADASLTSHAFAFYRLFPNAKFIHLLRNPAGVVSSLTAGNRLLYRSHYAETSPEQAQQIWSRHVSEAVKLEQALGKEQVMRINREDLLLDAEPVLRSVFDFVGESFEPEVMRPLV